MIICKKCGMPLAPRIQTQYEYKGPICGCEWAHLAQKPVPPKNTFERSSLFLRVMFVLVFITVMLGAAFLILFILSLL